MQLRPYQNRAIDEIEAAWQSGRKRVLYQLPTGGGKTAIKGAIARRAIERSQRVIAIAHRRELVSQISQRFKEFGVDHGLVQAREPLNPYHTVQVASVQTLVRRMDSLVRGPDLILIDEAHHATADSWRKVLDHWPHARVLGVTATPSRADGKGLGDIFQHLICGPSITTLQSQKFLAEYRYLAPPKNLAFLQEMRKARTVAGDYVRSELEVAVNKRAIVGDAIKYYEKHLNGRPAIAFCVGVEHARSVAAQFAAAGWRAASVDGSMNMVERDRILTDFALGRISVLSSADLISEGFDVPECAGALLMRPTKSLTIFMQQAGRALRPKKDGSKAVIVDHAGNVYDHGLPADHREWSLEGFDKRAKDAAPTVTQCTECLCVYGGEDTRLARQFRKCPSGTASSWMACGLAVEEGAGRVGIVEVDGELNELSADELYARDRPTWSGGISLSLATGWEWETLLARADSMEKLHEIAKARGYKSGWAFHQWKSRARRAAPVSH